MTYRKERGFSIIELLIVAVFVAVIAAIAIPNLLASSRAANGANAILFLRTIHSAQETYRSTKGGNVNYSPDLAGLDGLIDPEMKAGSKSGYSIAVTGVGGQYCSTAVPQNAGSKDKRGFANGKAGVVYQYKDAPTALAACSARGILTPGTAIE